MLKFNSEHKNINGSIKNTKEKIKIRNIILGSLIISSIFLYSGCTKNVECDIETPHAHRYVSEKYLDKYVISEKEHIGSWARLDDYIPVSKEQAKLIDFINDENLYEIESNKEEINNIISTNEDYIEYRYAYIYNMPIPHHRKIGKVSTVYYTYVPVTRYSWTADPNHSRLTGEERIVHHVYQGYKIVINEKGKYEAIESEFVDNLDELPDEYKYINSDFCKKVYSNDKQKEIDYEDGPEEIEEQSIIENKQENKDNSLSKIKKIINNSI